MKPLYKLYSRETRDLYSLQDGLPELEPSEGRDLCEIAKEAEKGPLFVFMPLLYVWINT